MLLPNQQGKFPQMLVGHIRSYLGDIGLGEGSVFKVGCMRTMSGIFIGVEGVGAAQFINGHSLYGDHEALARRLKDFRFLRPEQFANFADMINDQVAPDGGAPRHGFYLAEYCEEYCDEQGQEGCG